MSSLLHVNAATYELNQFPREIFTRFTNVREGIRWQIENGHDPREHGTVEQELDALRVDGCQLAEVNDNERRVRSQSEIELMFENRNGPVSSVPIGVMQ